MNRAWINAKLKASARRTARNGRILFNFRCPLPLLNAMDAYVAQMDTDRSKFIRDAVREKMRRGGARLLPAGKEGR